MCPPYVGTVLSPNTYENTRWLSCYTTSGDTTSGICRDCLYYRDSRCMRAASGFAPPHLGWIGRLVFWLSVMPTSSSRNYLTRPNPANLPSVDEDDSCEDFTPNRPTGRD
jgi:hypothetical protein